ncbi:hypothetical protein DSECCO2_577060 [anaerobic digester metagenome]
MPRIVGGEPLKRHRGYIDRPFGLVAAAGTLEPDVPVDEREPGPRTVLLLHRKDTVAPDVPAPGVGHAGGKQPAPVAPVPVFGPQYIQAGKGKRLAVVDDRERSYRLAVELGDEEPLRIGDIKGIRIVNPRIPPLLCRPIDGNLDLPLPHRPHGKFLSAHVNPR